MAAPCDVGEDSPSCRWLHHAEPILWCEAGNTCQSVKVEDMAVAMARCWLLFRPSSPARTLRASSRQLASLQKCKKGLAGSGLAYPQASACPAHHGTSDLGKSQYPRSQLPDNPDVTPSNDVHGLLQLQVSREKMSVGRTQPRAGGVLPAAGWPGCPARSCARFLIP